MTGADGLVLSGGAPRVGLDASAMARPADDVNPGGVLVGGDWTEGWQYGPLSVIELPERAWESASALPHQVAYKSISGAPKVSTRTLILMSLSWRMKK